MSNVYYWTIDTFPVEIGLFVGIYICILVFQVQLTSLTDASLWFIMQSYSQMIELRVSILLVLWVWDITVRVHYPGLRRLLNYETDIMHIRLHRDLKMLSDERVRIGSVLGE